jgi:hypothetical protein
MVLVVCVAAMSFIAGASLVGWFLCHFAAKIIEKTLDKIDNMQ